MSGDNGSVAEIEWLIEERKRRIGDLEEQYANETDKSLKAGLQGMLIMLRSELAELEHELDDKKGIETPTEDAIKEIDRKIADIDSQLQMETDKVIRNNLEVSKRFLQMERNSLLIKQTQKQKRKDPMEEKVEELTRSLEARSHLVADLQSQLEKAQKDLAMYKAMADHPERRVSCDTTRVTVTAMELTEIRNRSATLSLENGKLKTENSHLKNQMTLLRQNIMELTRHCMAADDQILVLQDRLKELQKKLDDRS